MPMFRGKDNKPKTGTAAESDRTEMLGNFGSEDQPTGLLGQEPGATVNVGFDGNTELPDSSPWGGIDLDDDDDEPMATAGATEFVDPGNVFGGAATSDEPADLTHKKGPVTGWLVVTKGPEKGESFALRHGPQIISRGEEADVQLSDPAVSRSTQATVHYDPNVLAFSLYRGQGTPNMYTARGGARPSPLHVGMNHVLELGDEIIIGDNMSTSLRFVPLCGETFSWRDIEG